MKTKLTALTLILMSFQFLNAQVNVFPEEMPIEPRRVYYQKDIFQDSTSLMVFQQVVRTDSVGKVELKKRFKNWGGTAFVNYSEVLVSETEDQVVLVFIVDVPGIDGIGGWYVRMIANFKDDRVRITLTDDGNTYRPARQYYAGAAARSFYINAYFQRFGKIDPEKNNMFRKVHDGVIEWRNKILSTLKSCGNALTQPATTNTDDW